MVPQIQISYENMGSSSYLAAAFMDPAQLVHYQLEMLAANEIRHFLPVTKRVMNGESVAYYNISSKIALSQILGRRKLSKHELILLLQGFLSAAEDGEQYQLPESGLVMEPDYIFMDPSSMEPSFLYLPVSVPQEKGIKELILSLVMEGKIELTGDNFVQVLLEAVNKQPFQLDDLKQALGQDAGMPVRQGMQQASSMSFAQPARQTSSMSSAQPLQQTPPMPSAQPLQQTPPMPSAQPLQQTPPMPSAQPLQQTPPMPSAQPLGQTPSMPSGPMAKGKAASGGPFPASKPSPKKNKKEKGKAAANEVAASTEEDGFDAEKAKKKFLIPQAVIMVAVAALVSFGAFTDETGGIAIKNILAVVLILAVTEVILYREAYVNSRNKGAKKASASKAGKKTENAGKAKPSAPAGFGGKAAPKPPVSSGFGGSAGSRPSGFGENAAPKSSVPSGFGGNAAPKPSIPSGFGGNAAPKPSVPSGFGGNAAPKPSAPSGFGGNAAPKPSAPSGFGTGAAHPVQPAAPFGQRPQQPQFQQPQQALSGYQPQQVPVTPSYAGMAPASGSGDETELWDGTQNGMSVYLEYYENGQLSRIPLDKPSVLIGRLKGQVDFAVANPKVGKIHAEFINQNGLIYVKDLNSKNGTYINGNGQRIGNNVPYPLSNNDRITLADSEFTLRSGS